MTTDLTMLVWTTILCLVSPLPAVLGLMSTPGGMSWGVGNRDEGHEVPDWVSRARRAHANLVENLAPFAALVLVAHVAGKANETTALGAQIFFGARLVYAGLYVAGVPVLRTIVYFISLAGLVLIASQIT